ncbi:MAG: MFS transporter [Flavobacteriales bacterium]|nr:MFS transporter [Flavobacteriales bacterium]|tara:strand:- start:12630 stop:13904 length:1275 start_codon:yes stop_codon:yes gene_type:complete
MKNKKAITLLFIANIISGFAQGISMLAIPWYFADILGMSSTYAKGYAVLTFISLFWSLYSGTLVDRYSRKKLFLYSNLACSIIIGSAAFYGITNEHTPWILALAVFGTTMFHYSIHYPNLYAFGQEITEKENYGKLNSYIEIQGQSTSIFAGAFAAILLSGTENQVMNLMGINIPLPFDIIPWEIHEIFLMDAITYVAAFLIIFFIKYQPLVKNEIDKGNVLERLKNGIKFLKANPLIFIFGVCSYMIFTFLIVEMFVLVPSYVSNYLHSGGNVFASSEVYYSIGAVLAGMSIRPIFSRFNTVFGIIFLMISTIIGCFLLTFTQSIGVFYAISLLIGITNAGTRVLRITYLFNHVPNNVIGRAGSVFNSISIIIRTLMIAAFSIPFFTTGENSKWGYLVGAAFLCIGLIPLLINYKKLVNLTKT